jgi:hypothetical protein
VRLAWLLALPLAAQQNLPHTGYVYPAGARQGATLEVTVGGQFLDDVNNAYISGAGVSALVVRHQKPLNGNQMTALRDGIRELNDKKSRTPEEEKQLADQRAKLMAAVFQPANASFGELATVRVTVEPDAAPGIRELRLATPTGLTNPLWFTIGQLPEVAREAARVIDRLSVQRAGLRAPVPRPSIEPTSVTLPAVINGQILPGAIDRYRFQASKGQRLVIAASVRALKPYISDAVPGWFQATIALTDAQSREVAYAGNYRFQPDPVLAYEVPADGEYTVAIRDSIYRGREDFVYRLAVGELPYITGIFPLGGKAGSPAALAVAGWNLPAMRLSESARKASGIYPISVQRGEWTSNRVPFAVDNLTERLEKEPNNVQKQATPLKLPMVANGRIDRPGDVDVFKFEGRAGQEILAEVLARRLDSPLDSVLRLTDSKGRQLAANDDAEDKAAALQTHHADSLIRFTLPAKGTYYIHLSDTQHKGGPEFAYRLRVGPPRPDFELRVTPAGINARGGGTIPITVYALRRDGFNGDIALKIKEAPPGFALSGGWLPAGQDKVRLTLTVPASRIEKPRPIVLEGRATIQGNAVHHAAVPAEDMMQAFFYHHLVPSTEWLVRVTGSSAVWRYASDKPVQVPLGGAAPVRVGGGTGRATDRLELTLNDAPPGISIQNAAMGGGAVSVTLAADAGKAKAGLKGNLILDAFIERTTTAADGRTTKRRFPMGVLPAIPFEVVTPKR